MKNKKNIYFLVPAVIIIWGLIGVRIYKTINPSPIENSIVKTDNNFIAKNIVAQSPYTIKANYRDPFLGTMTSNKKRTTKKVTKSISKKEEIKVPFPSIIYKGIVTPNSNTKKAIFLIEINRKQSLLKLNQIDQEVKLISGDEKEVVLEFQKMKKTFSIE